MNLRKLLPHDWNKSITDHFPLSSLQKEMDKLFDDFSKRFYSPLSSSTSFFPSVDVSETDKEIKIAAELPGIDEKDIELTLDNGLLTIKGKKEIVREEKEESYHIIERSKGNFFRSFQLPYNSITDKDLEAKFKKGVLNIIIKKPKEQINNSKKIAIKAE
ncbi:MAG: Hsp20/alpha crystallin family protein [Sphingobacteriia bacterium]|nr:Hsp20/alpha crystallin family protein [Sphingobacteriia bacterium]